MRPAWVSCARWKDSDEGCTPSRSAMTPAGSPSGPQVTKRRNSSRRVSWARAARAAIACFWSMEARTLQYFTYPQNTCWFPVPSRHDLRNVETMSAIAIFARVEPEQPEKVQRDQRANSAGDDATGE